MSDKLREKAAEELSKHFEVVKIEYLNERWVYNFTDAPKDMEFVIDAMLSFHERMKAEEAIGFAEWLFENEWRHSRHSNYYFRYRKMREEQTSQELFNLYLTSKQ